MLVAAAAVDCEDKVGVDKEDCNVVVVLLVLLVVVAACAAFWILFNWNLGR